MKEIIESFFRERSLVNHQLASYDDCIPTGDNSLSRMEKIVRSIRVGTDEEVEDEKGGLIKLDVIDQDIIIRVKNIQLGEPTIREADGSDHPSQPMECRLRKLTYMSQFTEMAFQPSQRRVYKLETCRSWFAAADVIFTLTTSQGTAFCIQQPLTRTERCGKSC